MNLIIAAKFKNCLRVSGCYCAFVLFFVSCSIIFTS